MIISDWEEMRKNFSYREVARLLDEATKDAQQEIDIADATKKALITQLAQQLEESRRETKKMADAKQRALTFKWVYRNGKYVASYQAYYEWRAMGHFHHCPKCKMEISGEVSRRNMLTDMANNRELMFYEQCCGAQMVLEV